MTPAQLLSILSALAAAVWSVWTWKEEHHQQRERTRNQEAALFVNTLVLAAEVLQSRLYAILEEDELATYREEYPEPRETASPPAVEFVYMLSQFLGWAQLNYRYGPFIQDVRILGLMGSFMETFDSRKRFPGAAFRLTIGERIALGKASVRHAGEFTPLLPAFEGISIDDFEAESSRLFQRPAVRRMLEALDRAHGPEDLEGRERLALLQNQIIELLQVLDGYHGYKRKFPLKRKRARLVGSPLPAALSPVPPRSPQVLHQTQGRIRLAVPRLEQDPAYSAQLESHLTTVPGVRSLRINAAAGSVVVAYNPQIPGADFAHSIVAALEASQEP